MTLDGFVDFYLSPAYQAMMRNGALVALLLAGIATVIAFANYGRAREADGETGAPWVLVIATLRDSFILTLLYAADNVILQANSMRLSGSEGDPLSLMLGMAAVFSGVIFQALIIGVAGMRVYALTRWLKSRVQP